MFKPISSGTITSASGFLAGAVHSGIKSKDELDLAILYSESPCVAASVFTTNQIKSSPVVLSQRHLLQERARAIVTNSGCANACVGEQGLADAMEMASMTGKKLGVSKNEVLVASTGIIGVPLPMSRVSDGIKEIVLSGEGGHDFARAIMTTDTISKELAVHVDMGGVKFTIGGVAKGAGMIHPNMATMLCFITTDASVKANFLSSALQKAVEVSFNMISIDGDTSPSDCVFLLANGLAKNEVIGFENGEAFQQALTEICIHLAKAVAQDGEGATKLIEVNVEGAKSRADAKRAAMTIVSSAMVKTAIHGSDPNWGRIVVALGQSGAEIAEEKLDVYLNDIQVMRQGKPVPFDKEGLAEALSRSDNAPIRLCFNLGGSKATAWGCDLSEEYVRINSEYST